MFHRKITKAFFYIVFYMIFNVSVKWPLNIIYEKVTIFFTLDGDGAMCTSNVYRRFYLLSRNFSAKTFKFLFPNQNF